MTNDDTKKWLEYQKKGVKPKRYKLMSVVYSEKAIGVPVHFSLNGYELDLYPLPENKRPPDSLDGYMPAFICEVVAEHWAHKGGNNFDIHEALDRVLPLLGFDYKLPLKYEEWEEYEDGWLGVMSMAASMSMLNVYPKIPNQNIHKTIEAYELLSTRNDKRAKKAVGIRNKLKEAVRLESISRRYSFLSYYTVIEIVSDDLCCANECPSGNVVAIEMSELSLSNKGSQRSKVYFLLKAIENDFDIIKCVALADVRNDLAHGEQKVGDEQFALCKKVSFWSAEKYAEIVSSKT